MSTAISDSGVLFANGDTQAYPVVPVRQTVLSGTVDSNGFSNFGGSTGSTTVTTSTTLIATAANGVTNRTGSIVNPSWAGLSTNGTMYLGLTVNADGTCTTFSTTLAPTYQWGGTFSVTANQRTFNIQAMQMQVGNGSTAAQAYDVFVGEVTVAGGVVTAIVWYALMGRYDSGFTNTLPSSGATTSKNHNIGTDVIYSKKMDIKCLTTEFGYAVGDITDEWVSLDSNTIGHNGLTHTRLSAIYVTGQITAIPYYVKNRTGGTTASPTLANWAYRFSLNRGW